MNNLKVIGKENIDGYEFTGIEGGFGDGTRGMLVRDIANIHSTTTARVNELINRNLKRFTNGIDIIDLRTNDVAIVLNDSGFKRNQINASKHIYLLSERGYSKLLKILEDDTAWDIYDKFVDGYFNMRKQIKTNDLPVADPMIVLAQTFDVLKVHDSKINSFEQRLVGFEQRQEVTANERAVLKFIREDKVLQIFKFKNTKRYRMLSRVVFAAIGHDFRRHFGVRSYESLPRDKFEEAKDFLRNWEPDTDLKFEIELFSYS